MNRRALVVIFLVINILVYGYTFYSFVGSKKGVTVGTGSGQQVQVEKADTLKIEHSRMPFPDSPPVPQINPFLGLTGMSGVANPNLKETVIKAPEFKLKGYMADGAISTAIIEMDLGGSQNAKKGDLVSGYTVFEIERDYMVVGLGGKKWKVNSDTVEEIKP